MVDGLSSCVNKFVALSFNDCVHRQEFILLKSGAASQAPRSGASVLIDVMPRTVLQFLRLVCCTRLGVPAEH